MTLLPRIPETPGSPRRPCWSRTRASPVRRMGRYSGSPGRPPRGRAALTTQPLESIGSAGPERIPEPDPAPHAQHGVAVDPTGEPDEDDDQGERERDRQR